MKKTLFMLAAASLAMTACTNTEEVEQGFAQTSKQIGFVSHVNKNTRALGNKNFSKFAVFGSYITTTNATPVHIFNKVQVKKSEDAWTYDEPRYWIDGANYTFYAYSKENETLFDDNRANGYTAFEAGNLTLTDYVVDGTTENQKDLVFASATATGQEKNNETVPFDFKHILSKIRFQFESNFPEKYTVTISNVKVTQIYDKADFTANTGIWGNVRKATESGASISATLDNSTLPVENTKIATSTEMYVLPLNYNATTSGKQFARVNFRLTVKNENKETVLETDRFGSFAPNWEQGKAYQYKVKLNGSAAGLEQIEFAGTIGGEDNDGWAEGTDNNVNFEFGADVPANA